MFAHQRFDFDSGRSGPAPERSPNPHEPCCLTRRHGKDHVVDVRFDIDPGFGLKLQLAVFSSA
jgi:hypothetical protein